jgi:uncharacterized RDD family membrane protein YckC
MNNKLFGKLGRAIAIGTLALWSVLPSRAQDDAKEKKEEPVALEQPVDSPMPAKESDHEDQGHGSRRSNDAVMVGNDFVLKEGEVANDVVVISGNATINGRVSGDLVVVGGSAKVLGKVDGELVVILGSASLEPAAEIGSDVTVVGGTLTREPGSKIGGTPHVVSRLGILPRFEALQKYTVNGPMMGRLIAPQVGWVWGVVGVFVLIYLMIALLFPGPIRACIDTLEKRPVGSFFMGILLFVLFAPLTFLLVVSVVGIAVIPFLFCAMIIAFLFGKVSVYSFAGTQLGKQFNLSALQLPLVALLIGAVIFFLLYLIPVLGFLIWGAVIPFGMGAAALAAFGGLRREGNGKSAGNAASVGSTGNVGSFRSAGSVAGAVAATPSVPASDPPVMPGAVSAAEFISLPRAGFWLRTLATALDVLLFVFVVILAGPKALLLWLIYHVAMWAWKGTTVGGIVLGIKLVRVDGRPVDVGVALVRAAGAIFSALVLGLGFFWAGWDRGKQSWHDKIAGTVMMKMPKGMPLL